MYLGREVCLEGERRRVRERERMGRLAHSLLTCYHLHQDTPSRPHINPSGVQDPSQQYLRCSVPSCGDIVSHGWMAQVIWLVGTAGEGEGPREAKVSKLGERERECVSCEVECLRYMYLNVALRIDENVAGLRRMKGLNIWNES